MSSRSSTRTPFLLSLVVLGAGCVGVAHARIPSPQGARAPIHALPTLTIQSPASGATVQGVAIIRFQVGDVTLTSPFATEAQRGPLPAAHLHVSVDGASWHWVHSSPDPVVITPLPSGEHTVTLELAGADHRPLLEPRTVRFTVIARTVAATQHPSH